MSEHALHKYLQWLEDCEKEYASEILPIEWPHNIDKEEKPSLWV